MKILIFVAYLMLSSFSNATVVIGNEADTLDYLLSHLKSTDAIVQQLVRRVEELAAENTAQQQVFLNQQKRIENLERRDYDQQQLNVNIRRQLFTQRRRMSSLEKFRESMKTLVAQYVVKEKRNNENIDGLKHPKPNKNINKTDYGKSLDDQVRGKLGSHTRIRRSVNVESIAFFATLSNHLDHAGIGQTFVFDREVTNLGNGYNNINGNFIAPVSGTYVFSATLFSRYHKSAHSQFMKNGSPVSLMYVSGVEAGYDTTSQTIVLELQKGDDISIQNTDTDASYHGRHYNTFSGFLLQQNFSDTVLVGRK